MINIVIYEDKANLRDSLKLLLQSVANFNLQAMYPNCKGANAHALEHKPDVILMDIDMPGVNGIEGVKLIKQVLPQTQIIMLTVFEDDEKIFDAIKAGADGYLIKKTIPHDLINAINDASTGGAPISPGIAAKVLKAFREKGKASSVIDYHLSKREQEVLDLLAKGYSYKRIASDMFVSLDTIRTHIKNIYLKLQVNSATEAVAKALQLRIVNTD